MNLSAALRGQAQEAMNTDYVINQLENRAISQRNNCQFLNALETGIAGGIPGHDFTDCSQYTVSSADQQAALAQNNAFPFGFEDVPMTMSLSVSLPIFTGFSRERQVSQLNNQAEDAQHARRAEELRLRTMVTNTYDNLISAYQVLQAEGRNRQVAEEQLQLQQRRYALGASDLLLLMDAQTSVSTADQAYLSALYDFHYNLIALEAAVGRPLRSR